LRKALNAVSSLGPSSLPVVVAQPDERHANRAASVLSLTKDMQTEQLLCWSGMTDTEHSTKFSSNEEESIVANVTGSIFSQFAMHYSAI